MKRIISAAAAVCAAIVTASAFFAEAEVSEASAKSSGFSGAQSLVALAKTPYDPKYTEVAWNTGTADGAGVLTAVGAGVMFPAGNMVELLSEKDGSVAGTAELTEKVSESCKGAALGNTYVQPTRTGIAVINTLTMEVVSYRSLGADILTDAAIIDSRVYIGAGSAEESAMYCLDMSDGLETVWEYRAQSAVTSPAVYGEYIVFGAGERLMCCESASGIAVENELAVTMCAAPFADEYSVYLSAQDGCVYKLRLTDEGTVEPDTLTPCKVGEALTRPIAYDGKLYVGAEDGFYILDSLNMQVEHKLSEIKRPSDALIGVGNGTRVYMVAPLEDYWCLYSIFDMTESGEPEVSKLAKLENFTGGCFTAAQSGTMYFRDAVGRVYALAAAKYSIITIIIKLVLLLAVLAMVVLILRAWVKQRAAKRPPQY